MSQSQTGEMVDEILKAAVAQLNEGLIIADADGRIVFINDAAARLHGVTGLGTTPENYAETFSLFTIDGQPYPLDELPMTRAIRRGETVVDGMWLIRWADGTEHRAIGTARPVMAPDGSQAGAVLTIRDDTARVRAEAAARERDLLATQLRAAFEQSPASTVVYDASGRPIAVNPAFERLWGVTLTDVPPGYTILTDQQLEAAGVLPAIQRAFDGEPSSLPPIRYEMTNTVGRGRVLWTEAHLYPVRDTAGAVAQVVLTHDDVTARREAEEALSRALTRTQQLQTLTAALSTASTPREVAAVIVEHAGAVLGADSIIVTRLTGGGKLLETVEVGAAPAEVIESWRTFPLDAPVPLAQAARTGQPIFIENVEQWLAAFPSLVEAVAETGHQASISAPLIVDGEALGAYGAAFSRPRAFDEETRALALTVAHQSAQALERSRLLESERAARAEAEAANRAKSDFLAIMSHELRTPLNAIGGYVELLEMGVRGPVTEAQRKDLGRIQLSQRHLLGLINEVLNYAKLESGSVVYDLQDVLVADALSTAHGLVAPQARAKGLGLIAGLCDALAVARCDPDKLQQILVNLLSNAVKFTDSGSIATTCEAVDDQVRIGVRDTGIGIAPDQMERIFEPFVQVRSDLTRTAEGAGLGLAISRELARAMGGDLVATSVVGEGSQFTLILPRVRRG